MVIEKDLARYRVESPVFLQQGRNYIESVLYIDANDDIAAYWGVLKVSFKISIDHMTLHKVVHNRNIYLKYHFCCCDSKECR